MEGIGWYTVFAKFTGWLWAVIYSTRTALVALFTWKVILGRQNLLDFTYVSLISGLYYAQAEPSFYKLSNVRHVGKQNPYELSLLILHHHAALSRWQSSRHLPAQS